VCLRGNPDAPEATDWQAQIISALNTIALLSPIIASSMKCYQVIFDLVGDFLNDAQVRLLPNLETAEGNMEGRIRGHDGGGGQWTEHQHAGDVSEMQFNNAINMMWPNIPMAEATSMMTDGSSGWLESLYVGNTEI
jgi:hypothetical protein